MLLVGVTTADASNAVVTIQATAFGGVVSLTSGNRRYVARPSVCCLTGSGGGDPRLLQFGARSAPALASGVDSSIGASEVNGDGVGGENSKSNCSIGEPSSGVSILSWSFILLGLGSGDGAFM